MYAAELRVLARQLMDHSSWGVIFQHGTSTIADPVRTGQTSGNGVGKVTAENAVGPNRCGSQQQSKNHPTIFHHSNFQHLLQQISTDAESGRVFPPARLVFRAFELTPLDCVKVVIIGQVRIAPQVEAKIMFVCEIDHG